MNLREIFGCTVDQFGHPARQLRDIILVDSDEMELYKDYPNVVLYREDQHLLIGSTLDPAPQFVIVHEDWLELVYDRESHPARMFMFFIHPDKVFGFSCLSELETRMNVKFIQFSIGTYQPQFNTDDLNSNFNPCAFTYRTPEEIVYTKEQLLVDIPMYDEKTLYETVKEVFHDPAQLFKPNPGQGYSATKHKEQLENLCELLTKI